MTPLCFIDTETTGLHVDRKVWEVGMIRRDDQGQRHITFYVDVDLSNADPFGLAIGRFYERHPLGRQLSQLRGVVRPGSRRVRRVSRSLPRPSTTPTASNGGWLHGHAAAMGAPHDDEAYTLPWKSDDLSRALGVEPPGDDERHTAMGDAEWAMRIFDAVTGGAHVPSHGQP